MNGRRPHRLPRLILTLVLAASAVCFLSNHPSEGAGALVLALLGAWHFDEHL